MIFCFNLYCKTLYFASLAYIVESSGGPEVFCISDVLASGSVRGFLAGKHLIDVNASTRSLQRH